MDEIPQTVEPSQESVPQKKERKPVKAWVKANGEKVKPSETMYNAIMAVFMRERAGLQPNYKKVAESFPTLKPDSIRRMVYAAKNGEIDMTPKAQFEEVKREEVRASYELSLNAINRYEAIVIALMVQKTNELEKFLRGGTLTYECLQGTNIMEIRSELKKVQEHKTVLEKGVVGNLIGILEAEARRKTMPKHQTNIQTNITVNQGPGSGGLPPDARAAIPSVSARAVGDIDLAIEQALRANVIPADAEA